ncbi:MAG: 50S ribosomal protein L25 [Rhodothermales bacterium]
MDVITLQVGTRGVGRAAARAVRREGNVPCVLYGHHVEPVAFQVSEKSLKPLIYTHETHLVKIDLDGDSWECIVKDIAFHPVTDRPLHADFQVLQAGEKITLSIPVRYLGTSIGEAHGGRTSNLVNELEVSCLPKDIPSHIDVDVSDVDIGDSIHVGELHLESIEIHAPSDQILFTVLKPRAVEVEVDDTLEPMPEGEAEEEAAEGEEE